MAHLGTLEGRGFVEWKDKSVAVWYRLYVSASRGMIDGRGSLDHKDSLSAAFNEDKQTLRMENGETATILINKMGSDGTHFLTSGVIPGGWENIVDRN